LQLLDNAKPSNNKLVDLEPTDSCPADRQPANGERADGQCANRNGGKRERPDRLRSDCFGSNRFRSNLDRWTMIDPRLAVGSIVVDDSCTAFTREHDNTSRYGIEVRSARFMCALT
jgi:hypothetical protein